MAILSIETAPEHLSPRDSQVIIVITGEASAVQRALQEITVTAMNHGKPIQGTVLGSGYTSSVITKIWKGMDY